MIFIVGWDCLFFAEMHLQSFGQVYRSDTWPKKPLKIAMEPESPPPTPLKIIYNMMISSSPNHN